MGNVSGPYRGGGQRLHNLSKVGRKKSGGQELKGPSPGGCHMRAKGEFLGGGQANSLLRT